MTRFMCSVLLVSAVVLAPYSLSAAQVGERAPAFSNVGADGKTYSLDALKGKWVVLEWFNPRCPYTQKHYGSGNMLRLQREWTEKGVVWLTVSTTAPADKAVAFAKANGAMPTAILMDLQAAMAKTYQAKTSPHMFVINPNGVLVYNGAIDDRPTPDPEDVPGAKNFVSTVSPKGWRARRSRHRRRGRTDAW